jgi:AcrR family transcriptional regulator
MSRPADPLARSKLLRAAREEFARAGLTEARVEDIARRAGVAKGSFYLHFKSKEEVFQALLDHFLVECGRFAEACQPNLANVQSVGDVKRFFCRQDAEMLEFLWAQRDILQVFYQAGSTPQYQHVLNAFLDAQAATTAAQLRELQTRGLYRDELDAEVVSTCIVGAYHNLTRHLAASRAKPDLARHADTIVSLFLEGLSVR